MAKAVTDPWVDEDTRLDTAPHAEDKELAALATEPLSVPNYDPADFEIEEKPGESLADYLKRVEVADNGTEALAPAPAPAPEPVVEAPPAAADAAEVHTYPDGSTLTTEKTKKGWKAVCDTGIEGVAPEVFYGATKDEMWRNVAAGKINATRKIREQNLKIKLEATAVAEPVVQPVAQPASRELTADDIFDIRTKLESNPDLAFETWFQKKTGLSTADLVKLVNKGATAADELDAESVARGFLAARPDYYNLDSNRDAITGWLTKKYLNLTLTAKNADDLFNRLVAGGHWTIKDLCEAYDDLTSSGLLETRPAEAAAPEIEPEPVIAPRAQELEPVTPPQDERIVRTVRRPRAGLGISSKDTTTVRSSASEQPPSADELDNLTDEQLNALYNGVRRQRMTTRR